MRFIQSPSSMFGHNLSRHTLKGEPLREESGMSSDETDSLPPSLQMTTTTMKELEPEGFVPEGLPTGNTHQIRVG
jgi:hypothetical protein